MKDLELEKTFLAKRLPEMIKRVEPVQIIDIYIPEDSKHAHLRLRQKGDDYFITKKSPLQNNDASRQEEMTIPLTSAEFEALSKSSRKIVTKKRYSIQENHYKTEVDVFGGALDGLVLIDFEFPNEKEMLNFHAPDYVLADVTQELFVAGGYLSGKKYSDLEHDLERYNYQRCTN